MLEAISLEYGQKSQKVHFEENSILLDKYVVYGGCTFYVPGYLRFIRMSFIGMESGSQFQSDRIWGRALLLKALSPGQ